MTESAGRETIESLGEFPVIDRIRSWIGAWNSKAPRPGSSQVLHGPGDDAAVLRPDPAHDWVMTCDVQVAGRHFLQHRTDPRTLGRRAMMVNLSDLAAMGAEPVGALVSLGLPGDLPVLEIQGLYDGFFDALAETGGVVLGGNLSASGPDWFIDLTLVGQVPRGGALLRSGAEPGDRILVTGSPGRSAAGLAVLERIDAILQTPPASTPYAPDLLPARRIEFEKQLEAFLVEQPWVRGLVAAHRKPTARVRAGVDLALLVAAPGSDRRPVSALIDLSDGLPGDLLHVCQESGVQAVLDLPSLPRDPLLEDAATYFAKDRSEWSLIPSDDYELLMTCAPGDAARVAEVLRTQAGLQVTDIGEIIAGSPPKIGIGRDPVDVRIPKGWDHFRPAR